MAITTLPSCEISCVMEQSTYLCWKGFIHSIKSDGVIIPRDFIGKQIRIIWDKKLDTKSIRIHISTKDNGRFTHVLCGVTSCFIQMKAGDVIRATLNIVSINRNRQLEIRPIKNLSPHTPFVFR